MRFLLRFYVMALLATLTWAGPSQLLQLEERATKCGQWDSIETGTYTVYNDLWGQSAGLGSQCIGVDGLSGTTLNWHTA